MSHTGEKQGERKKISSPEAVMCFYYEPVMGPLTQIWKEVTPAHLTPCLQFNEDSVSILLGSSSGQASKTSLFNGLSVQQLPLCSSMCIYVMC